MFALEAGLGLELGLAGVLVGDVQLAAGGQVLVFRDGTLVAVIAMRVMTAASLVPVMVTVMTWVALPPWPSSTVTVMVSVTLASARA